MNRYTLAAVTLLALATTGFAVERKDLKPGLTMTSHVTQIVSGVGITIPAGESSASKIVWSGYIQIVTQGKYTFAARASNGTLNVTLADGAEVYKALDARGDATGDAIHVGPELLLPAKIFRFTAIYELMGKDAHRIELLWQGPGFRREPVPYFFFGRIADVVADTQVDDYDRGRFLFEEHACVKCHAAVSPDEAKAFVDRRGPNLSAIGQRVYPGWLDAWLADPAKLRPHTTMPKMFADDATGQAERYAVVQYLTSLGGPMAETRMPSISNEYSKSIANGQKLFTTTGCAACHGKQLAATAKKSEDDEDNKPAAIDARGTFYGLGMSTGAQSLYSLGALGSKTKPEELQTYLLDPLKTNPHGRMPNMALNSAEARDLARHLCRTTDDTIDRSKVPTPKLTPSAFAPKLEKEAFDKLKVNDQWRDIGKRLLTQKGCTNCHTVEVGGKPLPSAAVVGLAIARTKPTSGCLSEKPLADKSPVYAFDTAQRSAIAAFLTSQTANSVSSAYQVRTALKRFNCLNCHQRDGEGGIGTELGDQMKKLENAENADDVQPPRLTSIGHKSKTSWLKSVLVQGGRARPWMNVRMPQYGEGNVGHLPEAFAHAEGTVPDSSTAKVEYTSAKVDAGRKLAGKEGLGCIGCHDISGFVGGGTRGPDLARTAERVRLEWNSRWMHNPQRITPGTRMPQNFNNGISAFAGILNGNADAQIEALWAYFSLGQGLPLPAGMEPPKGLILKVTNRTEMLRTFMPDGAGTKAIAIGYPGGVNAVFDAEQCRLSYAWEGNFLDASPVWDNRGGAPAKLLGPKFYNAPQGNPWGLTSSRKVPDFAKRVGDYSYGSPVPLEKIYQGPRHVQFDGYTLDTSGNPTFRYRVGNVAEKGEIVIADTPVPIKASVASGISRQILAEVPANRTTWLNAGSTNGEPRIYAPSGTKLAINWKGSEPEAPAIGAKLVLPDGDRAMVLMLTAGPAETVWQFVPKAGGGWSAILRLPEPKDAAKFELNLSTWSLPRDEESLLNAIGK